MQPEERALGVLVLAPGQGAGIRELLHQAGIPAEVCSEIKELCAKLRAGAGAVVASADALRAGRGSVLKQELLSAPQFSDLPVVVLMSGGLGEAEHAALIRELGERLFVTILPWPGPHLALVSGIKAALRERRRQCRECELQHEIMQERLRYLESGLSLAQAVGKVAVFHWDLTTGLATWTDDLQDMLMISAGPESGGPERGYEQWAKRVHPEDLPRMQALLTDWTPAERDEKQFEYRYLRGDEVRRIAGRLRLIRDAVGNPLRVIGTHADITERRRAEEALRASEEFRRHILESSGDCIKMLDLEGRLLSMNACGQALMEIEDLQPLIGRPLIDFYAEGDRAAARAAITQAAAGQTGKLQAYCPSVHGTPHWWDVMITPMLGVDGRPERLLAISREITQAKQAEQALRESEEKFRVLAEASRVMIGIVRDRRFLYVNPFLSENSGYTREELLSIDIAELIHPDFRALVLDRAQRRLAGEDMPANYEYLMVTKTGQTRWVEITPVRIDYRGAPAIIGTAVDITERKAALDELRQSAERFRAFFENATVGAGQLSLDGRFTAVNDHMCRITGYSREEMLRLTPRDITHPQDRDTDWQEWLRLAREEAPVYKRQKRYVRKNGEVIWVEVTAGLVHDAAGRPVATAGIIQDITQRKQAEQDVQHQAESLRLLSSTATRLLVADRPRAELPGILDDVATHLAADVYLCYLVTSDRQHLRLECSHGLDEATRRALEVVDFGQTVCATAAQTGRRIVMEDVQNDGVGKAEALRSMGLQAYACYPLMGDEVLGVISMAIRKRPRFTREELGVLQAVSDQMVLALIRERLNAELKQRAEELDAANRAKDHFLAVLSHELRTPLTPVLATASMLAGDEHLDPEAREGLDVIRRNAQMEARLIDDLLDMTRIARGQVELDRRPVELQTIVRRALEVCRPEIETRRLQLSVDLGEARTIHGDATRLEQVFWNLLNNAVKFTPPGGQLSVRCRAADGRYVTTEVTDSGVGIEPEALRRIFNAFEQAEQSHRRQFGGLGLGLAISKALIEMHDGTITAQSPGKGRGATFTIRLPLAYPSAGARRPLDAGRRDAAPTRSAERGLRILLVEDHADTAKIITWMLESAGYAVETAGDIRSALERLGQQEFDLLLSDLGLPDGSGLDLMRELRLRGYKLPGIALTGYGQQEDVQRTQQAGFARHLTKPIELEQLERAIAQQFAAVP